MGSKNHVATKERTVCISEVAMEDNNKKQRSVSQKAEPELTENK